MLQHTMDLMSVRVKIYFEKTNKQTKDRNAFWTNSRKKYCKNPFDAHIWMCMAKNGSFTQNKEANYDFHGTTSV